MGEDRFFKRILSLTQAPEIGVGLIERAVETAGAGGKPHRTARG